MNTWCGERCAEEGRRGGAVSKSPHCSANPVLDVFAVLYAAFSILPEASISKQSAWDSANQKQRQFAEAQVDNLLNGLTSAELKAFDFFPRKYFGHLYFNVHFVPPLLLFSQIVDLREITNGQPCPFGLQHLAGTKLQAAYKETCTFDGLSSKCTEKPFRDPKRIRQFRKLWELFTDESSEGLQIDHIIPLSQTGHDCFCNMQALTEEQHALKTDGPDMQGDISRSRYFKGIVPRCYVDAHRQCIARPDEGDNRAKIDAVKQLVKRGDFDVDRFVALFEPDAKRVRARSVIGGGKVEEADELVQLELWLEEDEDEEVNALTEQFQAAAAVDKACKCGLKDNDGRRNKCLSGNCTCKKEKKLCTAACFCEGTQRCKNNYPN